MILGILKYRYQIERQGKQIIVRKYLCCFGIRFCIKKIKLFDCELIETEDTDEPGYSYTFFIKNKES